MLKKILLAITCFFFYIAIFSQHPSMQQMPADKAISGLVLDSLTKKPLEFASVAAFRVRDSSLVGGTLSDINGKFTITNLTPGRYFLRINFVGYKTTDIGPIMISPQSTGTQDVGALFVPLSSINIGEVVIATDRPFVEFNLDKRVVNIEGNITVMGGTALDVLETVPSVDVDMDGNVSYRGSQNVTILIDGRPAQFSGESRKAALEQIPAETIETIELITNPSAKFDPEGTAGIINIVLKKKRVIKPTVIATITAGTTDKYSGNISYSQGTSKMRFFVNYSYNNNRRLSTGESVRESKMNIRTFLHEQFGESNSHSIGHSLRLGSDIYLNSKNTIGFSVNGNISGSDFNSFNNNTSKNQNLLFLNNYQNLGNGYRDHIMGSANLFYSKRFTKPSRTLNFDVNYSLANFDSEEYNYIDFWDENWDHKIDSILTQKERNFSGSNTSTILAKVDYTHPIDSIRKIETGTHLTMRSMTSSNVMSTALGQQNYYLDANRSIDFNFNENVLASYINYSQMHGKWSFSGGLRFEVASTDPQLIGDTTNYQRTYTSFYPSAAITKKIKEGEELQLTYGKRVNRPDFHSLSPFIDWSNSPNLRGGNPLLNPEYIHSVELGYMRIWKKSSIMPSVFYRRTVDLISRYRQNYLDTLSLATYANIASADALGFEFIYSQTVTSWWRFNMSASVFHTKVNGKTINGLPSESDLTNDDFSWSSRINSNMKLMKNMELQLNASYRGPRVMLQGKRHGMFMSTLGLKYALLDNKLNINFRVSDIFNTQRFRVETEDESFKFTMNRRWESRVFYLGVTFQINPVASRTDRNNRRMEENNMMEDDMF